MGNLQQEKIMMDLIFTILRYIIPIIGAIIGVLYRDIALFLSCYALGWICHIKSTHSI